MEDESSGVVWLQKQNHTGYLFAARRKLILKPVHKLAHYIAPINAQHLCVYQQLDQIDEERVTSNE
jgi:hypothetical protein